MLTKWQMKMMTITMNSKKMEQKVSIAGYLRFFYSVESTFFVEYDDDDNQKSDEGGDNDDEENDHNGKALEIVLYLKS